MSVIRLDLRDTGLRDTSGAPTSICLKVRRDLVIGNKARGRLAGSRSAAGFGQEADLPVVAEDAPRRAATPLKGQTVAERAREERKEGDPSSSPPLPPKTRSGPATPALYFDSFIWLMNGISHRPAHHPQ